MPTQTRRLASLLACAAALFGCGEEGQFPTQVAPGEDFSIADLVFDEAFFYCQVEPRVIVQHGCASGDPALGESGGGCHLSVTAFRLNEYSPRVADGCMGNTVRTAIPAAARRNYQTANARMRRDPEIAPLLEKPLQRRPHPRRVFDENSDAAAAIREWATRVSTQ